MRSSQSGRILMKKFDNAGGEGTFCFVRTFRIPDDNSVTSWASVVGALLRKVRAAADALSGRMVSYGQEHCRAGWIRLPLKRS